ncbi:unnamed protein product [Somion occarium]|uniref:G domain-containing protein n=1 Tax=Somion occarium TaxID=3059160 RepID=A0ABP1EC00_9APHY
MSTSATYSRSSLHSNSTDQILIAVMGATGAGKSSFINLVSGSDLEVGTGLRSCTRGVDISSPFTIGGRTATLIDTPGFDDTNLSDTEVLTIISLFLSTIYEQGGVLNGVLFFHRISDVRMGGISRRNFNMFRHLCGDEGLRNVVIVTNMWDEVSEEQGLARVQQLANEDMFFKPALQLGAIMLPHDRTIGSAQEIVRQACRNTPVVLRLQRELVIENKSLAETAAGMALDEELAAQTRKYTEELQELQAELDSVIESHDEQAANELAKAKLDMEANVKRINGERQKLGNSYAKEKGAMTNELELLRQDLQQERAATARTSANIARLRRRSEQQFRYDQEQMARLAQSATDIEIQQRQRARQRDGILNMVIPAVLRLFHYAQLHVLRR